MKVPPDLVPPLVAVVTRKSLSRVGQHELVALFDGVAAFPDLFQHFSVLSLRSSRRLRRNCSLDDPSAGIMLFKKIVTAHPTKDHRLRDRALLRPDSKVDMHHD